MITGNEKLTDLMLVVSFFLMGENMRDIDRRLDEFIEGRGGENATMIGYDMAAHLSDAQRLTLRDLADAFTPADIDQIEAAPKALDWLRVIRAAAHAPRR